MTWLSLALMFSLGTPAAVDREGVVLFTTGTFPGRRKALPHRTPAFETTYGPDSLEAALVLKSLTLASRGEGYLRKADKTAQRTVTILQQILGAEDANVALALDQLGEIQFDQHRYTAARRHLRLALTTADRTLGPHHPHVATILNDLAAVYHFERHYAEAENFYARALAIREKTLPPDHPCIAVIRQNLAELDRARGRKSAALLAPR
jgi:tetratricopeptide (TPR) repeat protein